MSKRHEWTFEYSGAVLADAAKKKATYHDERLKHYLSEQQRTEQELRQLGIEVREPVGYGTSSSTTPRGVEMIIDPNRQRAVQEAVMKVGEHRSLRDQYAVMARAMELNPTAKLPLHVDDIHWFGL